MQQVLMVTPAARRAARWCAAFRDEGFGVARATDTIDGLREVEAGDVSAVVLDLAALGAVGLTMLTRLRDRGYRAQLLAVVPARDDDAVVRSIEFGADGVADDDCSPRALAMRLRALTRRSRVTDDLNGDIQIGTLHVDVEARSVWRGDQRIELTRREFDLLLALVRERGCVVSPTRLLGDRETASTRRASLQVWRLVRTYIHALRRKLDGGADGSTYIVTIRGNGYMIPRIIQRRPEVRRDPTAVVGG